MNWEITRSILFEADESLCDLYVHDTSREDWNKWGEFVNNNYEVRFYDPENGKSEDKINLQTISSQWDNSEYKSTVRVFIGSIQINAHFFGEDEIENDLEPNDFHSLEAFNKLMKYMGKVSTLLNKEVVLTPENLRSYTLISVRGNSITIDPQNLLGVKEQLTQVI